MTVVDPTTGTRITWTEKPMRGYPLTRHWKGPSSFPGDYGRIVESEIGDTIQGRDEEIHTLTTTYGWMKESKESE